MNCAANKRRGAGLTLLELMVATTIFSIVSLSLYSAFQTGILTYQRIDSAFGICQDARIALNRIELDLKNSFVYAQSNSGFKGNAQGLEFFSVVDVFDQTESHARLTLVKYKFSEGILRRISYRGLEALKENSELESEDLSLEVKEVSFQYAYSTGRPDAPYDWQEAWPREADAVQLKTLPLAVKIKLSLREKKYKKETGIVEFNRTIFLPLSENSSSERGQGG